MNIGRYELTHELGRGGMAIVYLARDPYMKRQVAIKVLPKQFTFDPQFRQRFQREAEVVATLEHDAIVPVYDFGEHEGQPFIVMRYLPGGSLAYRLERGPLPIAQVAALFERVGAAVDQAHKLGIIHRDIKPGNILFDGHGSAALSDFGIAKISEATAAFTGTGGIVGTPAYMSPEQVQGDRTLDGRCDVYSLGVVLFECLSGQVPFKADTPMGAAIAHVTEPVPSILERHPGLPPAVEAVIRRALEKDPARRFQTAGQLAQAIKQVAGGMGAPAGTVVEGAGRTYVEPAGATYVEPPAPRAGAPQPPSGRQTAPLTAPPPENRRGMPSWLLLGGLGLVALCLVGVLAAGLWNGWIPNPLAAIPTAATAAQVVPSGTPLPGETPIPASPTPVPTLFVPEGLSTTYIEYILDASGSMLAGMDGTTRLVVAQQVLTARLQTLPDNTQVGLRVYGHRVPWEGREAESCADIELIVPIQTNGADPIIAWLPGMQALGMTPMSEAISQAANDFTFDGTRRNFIVLISDGEETCGDDPATVVQYLRELGIDFAIHVIGLDVDANTAAQLSGIADAGGGVYYDARSGADLDAALGSIGNTVFPPGGLPAPTEAPSPTPVPSPTPIPPPNADITSEGSVSASSIYDSSYPTALGVDGNTSTSWFSAGPEANGTTTYTWSGAQDDFIGSIEIISNRNHPQFPTNFGFGAVTVQVLDRLGNVVFEQTVELPGTPDPDVFVTPNVVGHSVRLIFTGSEAFNCGGFAELVIMAVR